MDAVNDCFAAEDLEKLRFSGQHALLAVRIPKCCELSRKERDEVAAALAGRARAIVDLRITENGLEGSIAKSYPEAAAKVVAAAEAEVGDLIALVGAPAGAAVKKHDYSI